MKRGLIIYQSKYGASRRYADWTAERTGFDCVRSADASIQQAEQYETVLWFGGVYASGIAGLSLLKKHVCKWQNRRVAVFCAGASPYDENALQALRRRNMSGIPENVPLFYGRGIWDEDKMNFVDRMLCKALQKSVAKKSPDACEPWMLALLSAAGERHDWTDRKYLNPLLEYLQ